MSNPNASSNFVLDDKEFKCKCETNPIVGIDNAGRICPKCNSIVIARGKIKNTITKEKKWRN